MIYIWRNFVNMNGIAIIDQETWELACERVGVAKVQRYVANDYGATITYEYPPINDPAAVVAMLDYCLKWCNGWQWDAIRIAVATGELHKLDGTGDFIAIPKDNRRSLAIAAAVCALKENQ